MKSKIDPLPKDDELIKRAKNVQTIPKRAEFLEDFIQSPRVLFSPSTLTVVLLMYVKEGVVSDPSPRLL